MLSNKLILFEAILVLSIIVLIFYVKINTKTFVSFQSSRNFSITTQYSTTNLIQKNKFLLDEIESQLVNYSIKFGGKWEPVLKSNATFQFKIAIIVPYRNRFSNLKIFLSNMHPFLVRQNLTYGIYLIEPDEKLTFNRGTLMNIGFKEALNDEKNWNCFFFHDVDMIPENKFNFYKCDLEMPIHYAVAVSAFNYSVEGYFANYYGGVNAFTKEQFININGFSNEYYGWGAEDDDLLHRTLKVYKTFRKLSPKIGKYYMAGHKKDKPNEKRHEILNNSVNDIKKNGIKRGLNTTVYQLKQIQKNRLFTHIFVEYPNKTKSFF